MDKLKEYLQRHKADLDVDSPAGDTWETIASKMPAKSGSSRRIVLWYAAAALIALAATGLWLVVREEKPPADTATHHSPPVQNRQPVIPDGRKEKTEDTSGKEEKDAGTTIVRNIPTPKRVGHKARTQQPREIPDAVDAIDKSYSHLIDYQLKRLRATPLYAENSSYFSFYVEQFKQMDQDEQQVRNDIKAYGLTNEFLEQLINVYQQKLNLLKNLQTEINKMNNKVREKAAPSAKTEVHYLNI